MARDIEIKKKVYDKSGFNKVVDRSFKSYGQVEEVKQPTTVDEFFSITKDSTMRYHQTEKQNHTST